MSNKRFSRLKSTDREWLKTHVLEPWGAWFGSGVCTGYPSRSPLCDLIDYRTRVSSGVLRSDFYPAYERDQWNSTTDFVISQLPDISRQVLFLAFAWHHAIAQIPEAFSAPPESRRRLKAKQMAKAIGVADRTFSDVYARTLSLVYDKVRQFRGLRGLNRLDL